MSVNNSANMNLPIPQVGVEAGPDYATDVNNCLTLVDQHNHAPGYGVQITPSGLNINSDLTMGGNNLTNSRSLRLQVQPSVLSDPTDLECIYATGVDLYFNDGNGNQIQITQNGGIAGSPGSISNLVAPASAAYSAGSSTFIWQSAAATPANMDGASYILRNLTASSKGLTLSPPNSMAADYSIVLPSLPASTNAVNIAASGVMGTISYDAIGQAMTSVGANAIANTRTRATGSTVAVGGVAVSSSSGTFSTTSSSYTAVTNLSVTITSAGRPIFVGLQSDGNQLDNVGSITVVENSGVSTRASVEMLRDNATIVGVYELASDVGGGSNNTMAIPSSSVHFIDIVGAGTYTYTVKVKQVSSNSVQVRYTSLIAYEL